MAEAVNASAEALRAVTPATSDEAIVPVEGHEGFADQETTRADSALRTIEGEDYAKAWLDRVKARSTEPNELAVLVAFMHDGELLTGFCRTLEKAVEGAQHG